MFQSQARSGLDDEAKRAYLDDAWRNAKCCSTKTAKRNGRFIRNVVEDAFGEQMYRISDLMDADEVDDETLTTITVEDLSTALTTVLASVASEVLDPATVVRTNQ